MGGRSNNPFADMDELFKMIGDVNVRDLRKIGDSLKFQFVMDGVELRKEVTDMIGPPLQLCPFESVRLETNRFGRNGILFTIDVMRCNICLQRITIMDNEIDNVDDIKSMSDVISSHPSLKNLQIYQCFGRNIKPNDLLPIVPASKKLTSLDLSDNNLRTGGITIIADCLASNPPLQELCLNDNKFNDEDAIFFANALESNTNLWKLGLKSNPIGKIGRKALCKVIFNPDSLNSVSSSNHTCDVSLSGQCKIPAFHGSIFGGTSAAIKAKKFTLISPPNSEGDVNISLLSDVPLEMLHRVLFFVHTYPVQQNWCCMEECLQGKALLESDDAHSSEYDDNSDLFVDAPEDDEMDADAEGITEEEMKRQVNKAKRDVQIKSLSVLLNVIKGLVVPLLFSA